MNTERALSSFVHLPTETDSSINRKPLFQLPADFQSSHDDYLRKVCKDGLQRRYGIDADASNHTVEEQLVLDRMERELNFITSASLSNGFLVIWDLLWDSSKDAWRWYNIGRGSVCGSLVGYLMPIHDVDPLKYNLLFERFLNEERSPCLFFGIDEGGSENDIVFQEAQKRYGAGNVTRRLEVEPVKPEKIVTRVGMLEIGCWRMDRFVEKILRNSDIAFQTIPDNVPEIFALLAKDDDRFYCATIADEMLTDEETKALRRRDAREFSALGHFFARTMPRNIEELIALYAIYRPGVLGFLDEYLRRRSGEVAVVYETPELERILKETYGIILYQEQFIQIINVISGLSLGKADCMRRSLGKRNAQQTEMWHGIFFKEAKKRGFSNDCIARIWEKLLCHSAYCYQKAHAVARALLLYRIAYVKAKLL